MPGPVGRHRRPARRACGTTPPTASRRGGASRRSPSSPSAATAAASWRRTATSTSCSSTTASRDGIDERGDDALVPAVGRRPQARSRRALVRRPAVAGRRRPRHGDVAAQHPLPGRRRGAGAPAGHRRAWRGGGATVAAGSTPCGPGCSSAGPRPATSPTCSSRTSRTATAGCATCRRCGGRPTPTCWCGRRPGLLDDCYGTLVDARVALHRATGRPGDVLRLEDQDAVADAARRRLGRRADGRHRRGRPQHRLDRRGRVAPRLSRHQVGHEERVGDGLVGRRPRGRADRRGPTSPPIRSLVLRAARVAAQRDDPAWPDRRSTAWPPRSTPAAWADRWPDGALDELVALLRQGHRAIDVLEALDQRRHPRAPAAGVGAGAQPAAAQRLPPLHRRPAPVGDGRQRRRAHRPGRPARPAACSAPCSTTSARATRATTPSAGMALVREIGPRLGLGAGDVATLVRDGRAPPAAAGRRHPPRPDRPGDDPRGRRRRRRPRAARPARRADRGRLAGHRPVGVGDVEGAAGGRPRRPHPPRRSAAPSPARRRQRTLPRSGDAVDRWPPGASTCAPSVDDAERRRRDRHREGSPSCATTCPGAFARIAGVLSLRGLDVLTAWAYSGELGGPPMAASQFRVVPPPRRGRLGAGDRGPPPRARRRAGHRGPPRRAGPHVPPPQAGAGRAGRAAVGDVPRRRVARRRR